MTDEDNIIFWMKFVKVHTEDGERSADGHLSELSCRMLAVELRRNGFEIVKVPIR